jgi:hypothetical protein
MLMNEIFILMNGTDTSGADRADGADRITSFIIPYP